MPSAMSTALTATMIRRWSIIKSQSISLDIKGVNHPHRAITDSDIGNIQFAKGDYDKAQKNFAKCLEIQVTVRMGRQMNVQTAKLTYHSIGNILLYKHQYDEPLKCYRKTSNHEWYSQHEGHPRFGHSHFSIGNVFFRKGDVDNLRPWRLIRFQSCYPSSNFR